MTGNHAIGPRTYVLIFGSLLLMTAITIWAAFLDLGPLNNLVALGIAATKAVLVILYFMHVRHSSRLTKIVVASGFVWLLILFALTMADFATRSWLHGPAGFGQ